MQLCIHSTLKILKGFILRKKLLKVPFQTCRMFNVKENKNNLLLTDSFIIQIYL